MTRAEHQLRLLEALADCVTEDTSGTMNTGQRRRRLEAIDRIARAALDLPIPPDPLPDLLAALRQIVLEHDVSGTDWDPAGIDRARALIAKAEGGAL